MLCWDYKYYINVQRLIPEYENLKTTIAFQCIYIWEFNKCLEKYILGTYFEDGTYIFFFSKC